MHNVGFHNLFCFSDMGVSKNSGKMGRYVECLGVQVILKGFLIGIQEGN